MTLFFYILAFISLLISTAAIYMALMEAFPVKWLYYHYFVRKPITWGILLLLLVLTFLDFLEHNQFQLWTIPPLLIAGLSVLISYKMHQENAFQAVDFPKMAEHPLTLPIKDDMQLAVLEYENTTKAYPLDYVIHHHIINDRFESKIISLTYCAMCRSIIPFDVTDIGPLFVGSFKQANMIIADRKTKTFFQQATFKSIIGKLHPCTLSMIPFQLLSWSEVKKLSPLPQVVSVSERDFRKFELPIPGIWDKIISSDLTPGLSQKHRDSTFPPRTHVIGIIDKYLSKEIVYLKRDVMKQKIVLNTEYKLLLVAAENTVNGFKIPTLENEVEFQLFNHQIREEKSQTLWDIRGKYISGSIERDLHPIAVSDEYWFSWRKFHPHSILIKLRNQ